MKLIFIAYSLLMIGLPGQALMLTGEVESSQTQEITMPMVRSWRAEIADMADEGSYVETGDFVVRIDGTDLDNTIESQKEALDVFKAASKRDTIQLQIDVNNARLAYEKAKVDYQIAALKASVPLEFIGELEYKERQLALKQIDKTRTENEKKHRALEVKLIEKNKEVALGLEQKQKELAYWQQRLSQLTIKAEQAGYIIHASHPWNGTKYQIGDQVQTGRIIVKVSKTTNMRIKAFVNAIDLPMIKKDMPVKVKFDALPNATMDGAVSQISAGGHDKKNWGEGLYYEITIALNGNQDERLLPGMSALVLINEDRP